ncbi:MAG: HNH endonuclease [Actinomycetota bacterium]|nr:HNH endonuclease [Actinomycetota bacterium]
MFQLDENALGEAVATMLTLVGRAENIAALATAEALTRGTVANSTATGAPGWVAQHATGVDPVVVHRVGAVGAECANPRNAVVAQCLAVGSASVSAAAVALREVPRVLKYLPGADRDAMTLRYLSLTPFGSRALKELSTRIIGEFAPEQLVREEEVQQQRESLRWLDLSCGLTRLEADLSAAHAAAVKHALQFLSAPAAQPCPAGPPISGPAGPDRAGAGQALDAGVTPPERDVRTPAKRRADALMRLILTAANVLDGTAARPVGEVGGSAKLVVTLDYNTLVEGLRETGHLDEAGHLTEAGRLIGRGDLSVARGAVDPTYLPGIGRTSDGDYVDAGTLRQLACDADLIPMVLGGASEPLDVGRAKRLFTGALRAAVIQRDQGCTFPHCDRPPDWCNAHHVNPWWSGGQTTLSNAALLCARHHTIVHRDLLTAYVGATGVTWDLTPGLMPKMAS